MRHLCWSLADRGHLDGRRRVLGGRDGHDGALEVSSPTLESRVGRRGRVGLGLGAAVEVVDPVGALGHVGAGVADVHDAVLVAVGLRGGVGTAQDEGEAEAEEEEEGEAAVHGGKFLFFECGPEGHSRGPA